MPLPFKLAAPASRSVRDCPAGAFSPGVSGACARRTRLGGAWVELNRNHMSEGLEGSERSEVKERLDSEEVAPGLYVVGSRTLGA